MNPFASKAPAAGGLPTARLQEYNHLVLLNQDECYSLAYNLLGDDFLASEVVGEAFQKELKRVTGEPLKFRLEVLQLVIQNAMKRSRVLGCPELCRQFPAQFGLLSNEEKLVCILVDCLELSYQEAAAVLGKPLHTIRKKLADTRFILINGSNGKG